MKLSVQNIHDLNVISRWLAEDDFSSHPARQVDMMILAGHAVLPNITGAFRMLTSNDMPVLLSGGVGHSTLLLKQALMSSGYACVHTTAESEAEWLAAVAVQAFGLRQERLLIENQSRNCGENADFSLSFLLSSGSAPARILLVQDPLMQRRTTATFRTVWARRNVSAEFISWPVFVPYLTQHHDKCVISGADTQEGLWQLERYVSMILGEVKRLRDDENGYGPAGMHFIAHIDLPAEVEEASQRLVASPELVGLVR